MKTKVLVDTSVWVQFFNRIASKEGETVEDLLRQGRAAIAGIVLTELLQGARTEKEFNDILDSIVALSFLNTSFETYREAGRLSYNLRRKGLTIPTTDLIIASLAVENKCSVYSIDPHFNKIEGIELYSPHGGL